ncbi:MAG: PIN domain-containing protein [Nitrospirae bacterium]|nr:PIN domain-containing protein [Nitrospirota bacterium]MCL5979041.1 PIN domain-containing protein [Nitrospirota bacterium]
MNIFERTAIIAVFIFGGYLYGLKYTLVAEGLITGLLLGVIAVIVESRLRKVSFGSILGGLLGLSIGLVSANFLLLPLRYAITDEMRLLSSFVLSAILGYGGLFIGFRKGKNLTILAIMRLFKGQELEEDIKLLDTSVIIDGRIADVIEAGFLEGTFIIPQFILQELQYIADSPDPMRRTKGRRGLDVLHRVQKMSNIKTKIVEEDFPKIKEVDAKLIALARLLNAKVITNDFNLNKVAQLQGVSVLNINELSNVLKPVVLPGETLSLFIVKEGKEYNQGVAYLDDGTMVVIENARKLIGKNVEVAVTSVLQTTAGRMIFAKPKDED